MKDLAEILGLCVVSFILIATPLDRNKIIEQSLITPVIIYDTNSVDTDSLVADSKAKTFKILNIEP